MSSHGEEKKSFLSLYFVLGSSLVMGMLTGGFVYLTVFAPEYKNATQEIPKLFVTKTIDASMYGECIEHNACASFSLTDDRSYKYLLSPDSEIVKEAIPVDLNRTIFSILTEEVLEKESKQLEDVNCNDDIVGLEYTYEVTVKQKTYTLDTCRTALATNKPLQTQLREVWSFMEHPTSTYPEIIEKGIGGTLINRFNNPPIK